jgi:hypothetical protein
MIKHIFLLLLISSCSSLNVDSSAFGATKDFVFKEKINVDAEFISSRSFSFILVTFKRNQAIFVLSNISNDQIYTWTGTNSETIKTFNGMVVEISNFDPEFSVLVTKNYFLNNNFLDPGNEFNLLVNLFKPDLEQLNIRHTSLVDLDRGVWPFSIFSKQNKDNSRLVQLKKSNALIGWNAIDSYFVKDDLVIKTIQSINPLYPSIKIEFFYKF